MPESEKQRKAVLAEVERRKKGGGAKNFKGMDDKELKKYSKAPLHKKGKGKARFRKFGGKGESVGSSAEQAQALRSGGKY
jgi:hypothetical protein